MYPKLVHLYGSLYVNSFGLCLAIALMVFLYFVSKDSALKRMLSNDEVINVTIYTAIIGVVCGRIFYILTEFPQYETFWDLINFSSGGSSVLGSIIGAVIYLSIYAYKKGISVFELLDIAGIYAPLIHGISRIGCFLAGCCYGCESKLPWAVTYTNPETVAPLLVSIHPTQLYSATIFFIIFLCMYFNFAKEKPQVPGVAFSIYLILSSLERLLMDFIRGDRIFLWNQHGFFHIFSIHQLVALMLLTSASLYLIMVNLKRNTVKV